jgi:hypothetical protein
MTRPETRRPLEASEPRQRTATSSPLAAALAQAIIEQHAKRAGLVRAGVGNVVDVVVKDACDPAHPRGSRTPSRRSGPMLKVIDGGRRAHTEP